MKYIATKNVSVSYKLEAEDASEVLEKLKSDKLTAASYSETIDIKEYRPVVTQTNNQPRPERRIMPQR